ncbi:fungal-specific transcription factor domain-containing protein [Xylogone sp. PMI_703]|nr:fungal-specific transcription factor domain-containing protein [Xylogone sp. PMI_703]
MMNSNSNDASGSSLRGSACVLCHKRKIKCDRNNELDEPCSQCVKTKSQCEPRDLLPPRRRKKTETILRERLRRYEEILRRHGIDPGVAGGDLIISPESTNAIQEGNTTPELQNLQQDSGHFISKDGKSIYLDNHMWKSVSNELDETDNLLIDDSEDDVGSTAGENEADTTNLNHLVFSSIGRRSLTHLHPSPVDIFCLWQIFLERVNPLTKVLHVPTVQLQILDTTRNLAKVPKGLEALMFAIYHGAVISLDQNEVEEKFKESRSVLLKNYRIGIRQAFINAGILNTSNIIVLQAFVIFILSARITYDPNTLWSLSGIAVRIAQRIGLHRDGTELRLSAFESEMRRRLWWAVLVIEGSIAHMSGSYSYLFTISNTRLPSNVNDSDLYPDMKEHPLESNGPTEMLFCMSRYEIAQWLNKDPKLRVVLSGNSSRSTVDSNISTTEKSKAVDEIERSLTEKIFRHCDQSIPLHMVTLISGRVTVSLLGLLLHYPRRYHDQVVGMSQSERDYLFSLCLEIAENSSALLANNKTNGYLWYTGYHTPWDPFIFLLLELRVRTTGDEVTKAWHYIDAVCSQRYEKIEPAALSLLHFALAKLALKAWNVYQKEYEKQHAITPTRLAIIDRFSRLIQHNARQSRAVSASSLPPVDSSNDQNSQMHRGADNRIPDIFKPELTGMDDLDYNIPMEWEQWGTLLQQFPFTENDTFR